MANNKQKIEDAFNRFNQKMENFAVKLPTILAQEALNQTLDNFKNESFNNVAWDKRKDKKNQKQILVKSRILRRSPIIYNQRSNGFTLGTNLPYAAVHNNGLLINRAARSETFIRNRQTKGLKKGKFKKGTTSGAGFSFKAFSYKMPQRRFIGDSPILRKRLNNAAQAEFKSAFKSKTQS